MSNTQSITLTDKQSRDINLLKGISILLVLFIHAKISTASFFIYAFHEPWMGYILKIIYKMVNPSGIANFIAPFVLVVMTVAYSYAAYILLKKYAPRLLSLLTGARNK